VHSVGDLRLPAGQQSVREGQSDVGPQGDTVGSLVAPLSRSSPQLRVLEVRPLAPDLQRAEGGQQGSGLLGPLVRAHQGLAQALQQQPGVVPRRLLVRGALGRLAVRLGLAVAARLGIRDGVFLRRRVARREGHVDLALRVDALQLKRQRLELTRILRLGRGLGPDHLRLEVSAPGLRSLLRLLERPAHLEVTRELRRRARLVRQLQLLLRVNGPRLLEALVEVVHLLVGLLEGPLRGGGPGLRGDEGGHSVVQGRGADDGQQARLFVREFVSLLRRAPLLPRCRSALLPGGGFLLAEGGGLAERGSLLAAVLGGLRPLLRLVLALSLQGSCRDGSPLACSGSSLLQQPPRLGGRHHPGHLRLLRVRQLRSAYVLAHQVSSHPVQLQELPVHADVTVVQPAQGAVARALHGRHGVPLCARSRVGDTVPRLGIHRATPHLQQQVRGRGGLLLRLSEVHLDGVYHKVEPQVLGIAYA